MKIAANAVLLDLYGTLLDHHGAASDAFLAACADWLPGLDSPGRQGALAVWQALEAEHMQRFSTAPSPSRSSGGPGCEVSSMRTVGTAGLSLMPRSTRCSRLTSREYEAAWAPFDDVAPVMPFLWEAPGGVAILSNGDRRQQKAKVASLGLHPAPRLLAGPPPGRRDGVLRGRLAHHQPAAAA